MDRRPARRRTSRSINITRSWMDSLNYIGRVPPPGATRVETSWLTWDVGVKRFIQGVLRRPADVEAVRGHSNLDIARTMSFVVAGRAVEFAEIDPRCGMIAGLEDINRTGRNHGSAAEASSTDVPPRRTAGHRDGVPEI